MEILNTPVKTITRLISRSTNYWIKSFLSNALIFFYYHPLPSNIKIKVTCYWNQYRFQVFNVKTRHNKTVLFWVNIFKQYYISEFICVYYCTVKKIRMIPIPPYFRVHLSSFVLVQWHAWSIAYVCFPDSLVVVRWTSSSSPLSLTQASLSCGLFHLAVVYKWF